MNPKLTPIAQLGDLATIVGYGNRLFRVDSYTHEFTFERGIETEEIYYDCTCVTAGEYTLGSQEDLTVVAHEGQTEAFLKTYEHPKIDVVATDIFENLFSNMNWGAEDVIKPIKAVSKKTKEPTKQERIDALLDERNIVEETDGWVSVDEDEYKQRRFDEIDAELKELTAE